MTHSIKLLIATFLISSSVIPVASGTEEINLTNKRKNAFLGQEIDNGDNAPSDDPKDKKIKISEETGHNFDDLLCFNILPREMTKYILSFCEGHFNNISVVSTIFKEISDDLTYRIKIRDASSQKIKFGDALDALFNRFPTLVSLFTSIEGCEVIGDDNIPLLTKLTALDISWARKITGTSLSYLTNLTSLNLGKSMEFCGANQSLSYLTNLETLGLESHVGVTDKSVSVLTNLTDLNVCNTLDITDQSMFCLTKLRTLDLGMSEVDDEDVQANTTTTDNSLSRLTNLTHLSLHSNIMITNRGLSSLTNLIWLDIRDNKNITDAALSSLRNLKTLLRGPQY